MSSSPMDNNSYFHYAPDILARYPNVVGGIIHAQGVRNCETPDALRADYAAEQAAVKAHIGATPLSELPSLAAWRAAFRAFGVDPTQYRCAAESLLRRLTKQGDIPNINTLVDIGNLVSIRYRLPVAVLDMANIAGGITVHFAQGEESFSDLGSSESIHPDAGEVIFTDTARIVHARRWCWRQSAQSAARETTTDILVTIEAHQAHGRLDVEAAQADMLALLKQYAGDGATRYESWLLP
jgi:DNA/RNA-binding domain of Phe-tRNA-synthetase-like protein